MFSTRVTEAKVTEFWHFEHKKKFSVMVTIVSQLCCAVLSLPHVNLWAVQSVTLLWNIAQGPNLYFAFTFSACV
jgi:hypothetical protein